MKKAFVLGATVLFASLPFAAAPASASVTADLAHAIAVSHLRNVNALDLINWKVGDTENMAISADSMGNLGTMVETVETDTGTGIWVKESMALEGQNDVTEMLMNKADGKILQMKHNGQDEAVPDSKVTIVSQDYTTVTVPAGTFKCLHVVANSDQAQGIEIWANPQATVMEGALKELIPTQFGLKLTLQLTSFTHGK